jgi:hypothetical protein
MSMPRQIWNCLAILTFFLGLAYIIPTLKCVQNISKLAESYDVFICEFVVIMKKCENDFY